MPPVTIIVLNWNGRDLLDACLSALTRLDYPNFKIILVDNASSGDSVAFVRSRFAQVIVHQNAQNLGYAGGNNAVLRNLASEFVVLVNPDVVVARDWLRALIAPMLADERIGIVGCKLYYPGGRILQHAGATILGPRAMPRHFGGKSVDTGAHDALRDVDYVTGAVQALRRAMLDAIGLLDEGYFLYFEDADLCRRARRAGYRVVYAPQATAVHDESALTRKGSDAYLSRFHTGRWRYLLKHRDPQTILAATTPAEATWLAQAAPEARHAADQAYRTTLGQLGEILAARVRDGAEAVTAVQQQAIVAALERLRRAVVAWPAQPARIAMLREKAVVAERPLASPAPFIGPLLTFLRRAWYSVAARWYVRALRQQQNAFNQQLVQALSESETHLQGQAERWLAQDNERLALRRTQAELREVLARTEALVTAVEAQLAKLKEEA